MEPIEIPLKVVLDFKGIARYRAAFPEFRKETIRETLLREAIAALEAEGLIEYAFTNEERTELYVF